MVKSIIPMGRQPKPKKKKPTDQHPKTIQQKTVHQGIQVRGELHQGPLPPPQTLGEYDNIVPGAAERIIAMAENQSDHRQKLEMIAVKGGSRDSLLGLIFGLTIGLSTVGGAVLCILNGHTIGGSVLGGSGLAGLVGVFVYGSRQRRMEREQKLAVN